MKKQRKVCILSFTNSATGVILKAVGEKCKYLLDIVYIIWYILKCEVWSSKHHRG
jgi:hypothetical protein